VEQGGEASEEEEAGNTGETPEAEAIAIYALEQRTMDYIFTVGIVIIYLIVVAYLAYKGWRRTRTTSDYLIAGREMHPGVMVLSYGATFVGTTVIIGFGGAAALFGFSLLWLSFFNILVGVFIAFVFFGKRTRRMGLALDAHTFPELLGERYQSRFIQWFAGLVILAFIQIYAAAILIGIARFIEVFLYIPYTVALLAFCLFLAFYVIIGGLKAVMYTDAFHGVVLFVMMAILCFWTYHLLGGIIPAHQALTDIAPLVPEKWVRDGHQGWTAGLQMGSPFWWIVYSSMLYGVGIGVLAQPQLVVRLLTVASDRVLHRWVVVGGVFILVMTGVPLVVGPLTNVIFLQRLGELSIAVAGGNVDTIIPLYIDTVMPWWFGALFLVGMLAASMATVSSQVHIGGTSLGRDFYGRGLGLGRTGAVFFTKVGIVLTIIAAVIWGLELPSNIIAGAVAIFFGLCAASFLPLYFLGLYWRGVTKAGGVVSMIGGLCMSFFWMIFFHYQESAALGICQLLFGRANLVADFPTTSWIWKLQYVDPLVIALPVSFALCVGVSRFTRTMTRSHLKRCFRYIKR
jgi:SSS family solute:Na+ symporter